MVGSARKRFERAEAERLVGQLSDELVAIELLGDLRAHVELLDDAAERVEHLRTHRGLFELRSVDRREVEVLEEHLVDLTANRDVLFASLLRRVALGGGRDDVLLRRGTAAVDLGATAGAFATAAGAATGAIAPVAWASLPVVGIAPGPDPYELNAIWAGACACTGWSSASR